MVKLSFYEQVGILIPGSLFLAVLLVIVPGANAFLSPKDISVGEFGVFLIVAYAAGHAIAAVGNMMEFVWWKIRGGMPTDWVVMHDDRILNTAQKGILLDKVKANLGIHLTKIAGLERKEWAPVFRQVYRYAMAATPGRIETFNGNYGLNRGLAAALFSLAAVNLFVQPPHYVVSACLVGAGIIYGYRMNRFGVHFAREVYLIFLNAKAPTAP